MSNEASAWAFAQPIPPAPKMVLLALANNANKNGEQCFPSIRLIVENCAPMKERTVQYHLKWLAEQAKLITITPWFQSNGRQTSNLYTLLMTTTYCGEGARSCTGGRVQEVAPGRVQEVAPGRVQEVAPLLNPDSGMSLEKKEIKTPQSPHAGGVVCVVEPYSQEFHEFWREYPNKTGKKDAWRAWQKARDRPKTEDLLTVLEQAKRSDRWCRGYIPNPATWLNQGRWADELPTSGAPRARTMVEFMAMHGGVG